MLYMISLLQLFLLSPFSRKQKPLIFSLRSKINDNAFPSEKQIQKNKDNKQYK